MQNLKIPLMLSSFLEQNIQKIMPKPRALLPLLDQITHPKGKKNTSCNICQQKLYSQHFFKNQKMHVHLDTEPQRRNYLQYHRLTEWQLTLLCNLSLPLHVLTIEELQDFPSLLCFLTPLVSPSSALLAHRAN